MKVIKKWKDLDKNQIEIGKDNLMFCNNIPHSTWNVLTGFEVVKISNEGLYLWSDGISEFCFTEEHVEDVEK